MYELGANTIVHLRTVYTLVQWIILKLLVRRWDGFPLHDILMHKSRLSKSVEHLLI